MAEDRASAEVLAEKPRLDEDKVAWLQRHDREAGDLYGALPLCIGMPVAATDSPLGSREGRAARMFRTGLWLDARHPHGRAEQTGRRSPLLDETADCTLCAL